MSEAPHIAAIAGLIAEPVRSEILMALLGGQALTANELAGVADVAKPGVGAHLERLVEATLVAVQRRGRHAYFRLADGDVARLLESRMGIAFRSEALHVRSGPREPALRKARVCYDHLAGDLAVRAFDAFVERGWISQDGPGLALSRAGLRACREIGLHVEGAHESRRPLCRVCLDWSARRDHLAGHVGAQLLGRCYEAGWAKRRNGTRIVDFTPRGEREFLRLFE